MQRQRQQQQQQEQELPELPLRITNIQIEGARSTNPQIPIHYLQLFNQCRTLAQLTPASAVISNHMVASGLYKDVRFDFIPTDGPDLANHVKVFCVVQEPDHRGIEASLSTSQDTLLPTARVTFWTKNFLQGNGEKLTLSGAANHTLTANSGSIAITGLKNDFKSPYQYHVKAGSRALRRDWVDDQTHAINSVAIGGSTYDNVSTVQYEIAHRTSHDEQGETSATNLKSAISLTRSRNFLDNNILPRMGSYYKHTTEISGLLGDAQAVKFTTENQYHKPLNSLTTLSLSFDAGIQQPITTIANLAMNKNSTVEGFNGEEDYPEIPIYDRFFGNTLATRGISPTELGPKSGQKTTGADAFASASAVISFTLPALQDVPVRPHLFLNASQFMSLSAIIRSRQCGSVKITDPMQFTASAGVGVAMAVGKGKVEVNYGFPLKNGQILKPALSIGFSSSTDL